jgi:hypothetical protein
MAHLARAVSHLDLLAFWVGGFAIANSPGRAQRRIPAFIALRPHAAGARTDHTWWFMRSRRAQVHIRDGEVTIYSRSGFTHTAYNDFEVVAANLLDKDQRRISDRIVAYNLYTDAPLGRVGMNEAEVRKSSKPALIGTMAMENVSRALEKGETKGFMQILVDGESKRIRWRVDPGNRRR